MENGNEKRKQNGGTGVDDKKKTRRSGVQITFEFIFLYLDDVEERCWKNNPLALPLFDRA